MNSMSRKAFLTAVAIYSLQCSAAEYFLLPAAVRLEGVGGIYGIAAGAEKIFGERTKVTAGASFGGVSGAGILLSDVPLGVENLGLNLAFANVQKARFKTSYSRGLSQVDVFEQEVSASVYGATFDWLLFDKKFKLSAGMVLSEINLDDFYLDDQRITRPNTSGYHPIKTTSKIFSADWDGSKEGRDGFKFGVGLATAEGRAGQSDLLVSNWRGSVYVPLAEPLTLAFHARWSDAYITKKATRYTDSASAKAALGTNCAAISDATEQARCERLENSIADYIAQSNSFGTAAPIGGSNGLRAYDELSVRAAHTRLFSTELRWTFTRIGAVSMAITPFYDLGWSADEGARVFDKGADSYGAGLRATYKSIPFRLAFAESRAQSAWFFTMGQDF